MITWDECFEPCVVTSFHCDSENLVNDGEKIMLLRMQECYRAVSAEDKSWSPQLMCVHRGKHREGLSKLAFAALFSLGFSPLYHSVCCPAMISDKATVKTKKESSNNLFIIFIFYLAIKKEVHPGLPTDL